MKPLPHDYSVQASAQATGVVELRAHELPPLSSSPPREFGGPGDAWSPEELLLASIVDCFVLTFRAIARASKLSWKSIDARVDGVLERVDHVTRFTHFTVHANLDLGESETPEADALRILEKAEHGCLISNSLGAPVKLEARVLRSGAG